MKIVQKSHQQHPLFLRSEHPSQYISAGFHCQLCESSICAGFFYHCYLCDFHLDIDCAFRKRETIVSLREDLTLYHPFHKQHQLKLQQRPSSFLCDGCQVEEKDFPYHCTSCNFWIHKRCAMLPSITNHDVHAHPLTLSSGLPSQYTEFPFYCDFCNYTLHEYPKIWIYYCALCRYFIHIKCMEIKKPQVEVDLKGIRLDELPRLPMSDKSVELIQRFLLKNNSVCNDEHEISLFSHKHPLIYSKDANEDGDKVSCDGCLEPIVSPPYYHCVECRYFLHLPCAKLPHEFEHPHHPHPLILTSKTRFYDGFNCNLCGRHSNGLFFCCNTEGCNFNLDVKCASLSNHLVHETHNHILSHIKSVTIEDIYCRGCGLFLFHEPCYGCEPCYYYLHAKCLLLPTTIKNRFDDKHRLKLRYPPHSYHPKPFDCAECEKAIDPSRWLYHCGECELSLHVYCIHPSRRWNDSSKYGQKHQVSSHPHPLRYVYRPSIKSPCQNDNCGRVPDDDSFSECETCNFHICKQCLQKIEPPSSSTR